MDDDRDRDARARPVRVEGDWAPEHGRILKNKLELYFQSRRKSGGGECAVEVVAGAAEVAVVFHCENVRQRVLAKKDHQLVLGSQTVKLRLSSASVTNESSAKDNERPGAQKSVVEVGPGAGASDAAAAAAADADANPQDNLSRAVLLEWLSDNVCRDLLQMLLENVSGLDEGLYTLEIIWEANKAVVVFNQPKDAAKFLALSLTNEKMKKFGVTARPLEPVKSVQVEGLPPSMIQDMLEMYFGKSWTAPDSVVLNPEEKVAIVSFQDPKVVESICRKEEHLVGSTPVRVYPFSDSLGSALYGKARPTWKIPQPVTKHVHHAIWKFLSAKSLFKGICDQMKQHFCVVDPSNPEVSLSPLPSLVRQRDLTANQVDAWASDAKEAFRALMSHYSVCECPANTLAWKAAEKDVLSVVQEDAFLEWETSRQVLIVAGRTDDVARIRAPVEASLLKAMSQIERKKNEISDVIALSPANYYILEQGGLQKASLDISPQVKLSYQKGAETLTVSGIPAEVHMIKKWILERNASMVKKLYKAPISVLDFLKTTDLLDMSQDLFTSQGISAIFSLGSDGVSLSGASEGAFAEAERQTIQALSFEILHVEDQGVLRLPGWSHLSQQLLDTYNTKKKKTVAINICPETGDKVAVAGFLHPMTEVSRSLKDFLTSHAQVQETVRVKSRAVIQFIDKAKSQDLSCIAKAHGVDVRLDFGRPRIHIAGARLCVNQAKSSFRELIGAFCTDNFTVDKPGAKKYFQIQGAIHLSSMLMEIGCVAVLRPDDQEEEDEVEEEEEEDCKVYCRVRIPGGVLISAGKADICRFKADAVVNAANEDLQHIGGLALALLKAAGPQLQQLSNDYISKHGGLRPGDAIVTAAGNLPCKFVIHAVGPRFSAADNNTSVSRLKMAVKESLRQAELANCSTVAMPAISSGVFGFPVELCTKTIAQAVREYCEDQRGQGSLTEIHLLDNHQTATVLARAVQQEFITFGPTLTLGQHPGRTRGAASSRGYRPGRASSQRGSSRDRRGYEGRGGRGGRGGGGVQGSRGGWGPRGHSRPSEYARPGRMQQTMREGVRIVLRRGNIQDQRTDIIVNTISEHINLDQGAVSKAILEGAGAELQSAARAAAGAATLPFGSVVFTTGFKLACQEVFHVICPFWNGGQGQAEEVLTGIVSHCLAEAERHQMASLSFPAIGTGTLSFPRDVVSRVLLGQIHAFRRRNPRHLREVHVVVHPSDSQTWNCFTREFKGQGNIPCEVQEANPSPVQQTLNQPQASHGVGVSASFSLVASPALGVYQMQLGQLTLEVSSGDITKETSHVIVNSSNPQFDLKSGVSKAILDSAGPEVEKECHQIVTAPGYQPCKMILTSAGLLSSKRILHVIGQKDPAKIKDIVHLVLTVCEENNFSSVSFPALGTGQAGAPPAAVADAMVDGVVDFVRKKHVRSVQSVKIVIFQASMAAEFHRSMKRMEGQEVEEKGLLTKFKDSVTSLFKKADDPGVQVLEREEFEPTVFLLCADTVQALDHAKIMINKLIVAEQAEKTIIDPFVAQLTQADVDQLRSLQRKLTVCIRLDSDPEHQKPRIHLEGLTRDVMEAESTIREILLKVERNEILQTKALNMATLVQWQFQSDMAKTHDFDIYTNLSLEEALQKKESVEVNIGDQMFTADVMSRKAVSIKGIKHLELVRKEIKDLPAHWDDMKGQILMLVPLDPGSKEHTDVSQDMTKTTLTPKIHLIERVQNVTLWQSYQLMKKRLEVKNKHTNNEKVLFHGTHANVTDHINNSGFNRSYAGKHGAMYGNGSYFAVDPAYSAQGYAKPDASGQRRMYRARVLVGDHTTGQAGMIAPPSKGSGNPADLYDSVSDNSRNPRMFVVFNDIQAYPEYLITFT